MERSRRNLLLLGLLTLVGLIGAGTSYVFAQGPTSLRPAIDARYPGVEWVSTRQLASWMEAGEVVLLDARQPAEYRTSHLRGARRVDPERPNLGALGLEQAPRVVVYCSVGYRSAAVAQAVQRLGVREVYNLAGGIFEWANEGRALIGRLGAEGRVHPYDTEWGRLLDEAHRAPR